MKKTPEDIIILHICNKNMNTWYIVPEIWCALNECTDGQTDGQKKWKIIVTYPQLSCRFMTVNWPCKQFFKIWKISSNTPMSPLESFVNPPILPYLWSFHLPQRSSHSKGRPKLVRDFSDWLISNSNVSSAIIII